MVVAKAPDGDVRAQRLQGYGLSSKAPVEDVRAIRVKGYGCSKGSCRRCQSTGSPGLWLT